MNDFTHHDSSAKRENVLRAIMYHLQIAKRIADVQDCISPEEYLEIKWLIEKLEKHSVNQNEENHE